MAKRAHKADTMTFEELDFSEQAKSISAQLVNVQRAILRHARHNRATPATRRKLVSQSRRLADRIQRRLGGDL